MVVMSKVDEYLCPKCQHFERTNLDPYWSYNRWGRNELIEGQILEECNRLEKRIRRYRYKCKYYLSIHNRKLIIGGDGVVNISKLPNEGVRIDLKDLPEEAELRAIGERFKEGGHNVASGLVIEFEMRDGAKFHQKYTAVSGAVLSLAMKKLKIKETEKLQDAWYNYKLTPMRMGKARMIPTKKVAN